MSADFGALGLDEPLLRAVFESGYEQPTPIQSQAIPPLLQGRDLLGCARTGTGKTAAFALPILQILSRGEGSGAPRALVLVPTRELASQVTDSFREYGRHLPLRSSVVYGGVHQRPQVKALQKGLDVLVATPGRLLDLVSQGHVKLAEVEILVLDEADHMLDLGFIPDVRRIVAALPRRRHSLLFSATMPPPIEELAHSLLRDPVTIKVSPPASTAELVAQWVLHVDRYDKPALLARLLARPEVDSALVFTRTKRAADRVAHRLKDAGLPAVAIHGDKIQQVRERALKAFREGKTRILVATDVAARGLDVEGISLVVNYDLPNVPETYVHRIGRTGRAGAGGTAVSLVAEDEKTLLRDVEKLTQHPLQVMDPADVPDLPRLPRSAKQAKHGTTRRPARPDRRAAQPMAPVEPTKPVKPPVKPAGKPAPAAAAASPLSWLDDETLNGDT